jgi:hypothetical protein
MTNNSTSLIDLGQLSKPATVLIEKISDAIGGIFRPYQIRRVAEAEAQAEKIKAVARIEITELQQRALGRFLAEEARKQANIEEITQKALPDLKEGSRPQDVEDDWITNFFDKCRLISDNEMQSLWAKILAGEANAPGKYTKRTVNFLSSIDKSDAMLFTELCGFGWFLGNVIPLIYEVQSDIYTAHGMTFESLKHLDEIGLLSFEALAGYTRIHLPEVVKIHYYSTPINIKFAKPSDNELDIGKVLLSRIGQELAPISGSKPVEGFLEYIIKHWAEKGLVAYSDWPNKPIQRMADNPH